MVSMCCTYRHCWLSQKEIHQLIRKVGGRYKARAGRWEPGGWHSKMTMRCKSRQGETGLAHARFRLPSQSRPAERVDKRERIEPILVRRQTIADSADPGLRELNRVEYPCRYEMGESGAMPFRSRERDGYLRSSGWQVVYQCDWHIRAPGSRTEGPMVVE